MELAVFKLLIFYKLPWNLRIFVLIKQVLDIPAISMRVPKSGAIQLKVKGDICVAVNGNN